MFHFIRNNILLDRKRRNVLFNTYPAHLFSLFDTQISIPCVAIRPISNSSTTNHNSFTVSYLVNSCGLSVDKAVTASKKVQFQTSTKPDSVLTLFRNNGFSDNDISMITQRLPALLVANTDKNLKPKFDYFISKGLSSPELANTLSSHPEVLLCSLDEKIIPSFDYLTSIVGSESKVIALLKRGIRILRDDLRKQLAPKVALLRASGVSNYNIERLLVSQPNSFMKSNPHFNEIVQAILKMGIPPSQSKFVVAIHALTSMSKSTLKGKIDVYRKWGLSEDDVMEIFTKEPRFMIASEKKIARAKEFLSDKMGYDLLLIIRSPIVLLFSMEKRIIPRCSVIQLLISNGIIAKDFKLSTFLCMSEKDFFDKFVSKYEEKVPVLLNVYQGKGKGKWMA